MCDTFCLNGLYVWYFWNMVFPSAALCGYFIEERKTRTGDKKKTNNLYPHSGFKRSNYTIPVIATSPQQGSKASGAGIQREINLSTNKPHENTVK